MSLTQDSQDSNTEDAQTDSNGRVSRAALLTTQRAQEMAAYTERLLEPWRRRGEEQAEEVGRLKAELSRAEEQIREAGKERAAEQARTADELGRTKLELEYTQRRALEAEAMVEQLRQAQEAKTAQRPWWRFW